MSLIISSEDIGNYEHLPNHDSIIHRVQIRIKQAQDFDLPKILPQKLIDDIVTNINSSSEEWVNLINKVRPVMVYFAFARFIEWHDFNTESFGFAKVNTNYSQKLQQGEKDQAARNARSLANGYASALIDFLNENSDDYDSYTKPYCGKPAVGMTFKIKAIG